ANPMRYTGGLTGGSWMAALASDLGNGTFDGASLVQNFENLNPANTLWTKQYNLYSKVDTEAPRYLEFEKYWDTPTRLTAAEIQFIVDNLFVGNKLSTGEIVTSDGTRVDLRAIRSPIVVFCSKGDNITPPQQALGWILDLYGSVDDIRMYGQTIVYAIHESVGHLGIFVSGGVARKEHDEFASNIDLIDVLPPGLYEAVLHAKAPDDVNAALAHGSYIARFEPRTLDDIRALGGNDDQDERCFATVARLSEINHGLYRTVLSPFVRAATNEFAAEALRRLQPLRLQNELASDSNPLMRPIADLADQVRQARRPAAPDNIFLRWQEEVSKQIVESLNAWRDMRDRAYEQIFFGLYSLPALQAAVGEGTSAEPPRRRHLKEPMHHGIIERQIAELKGRMSRGGIKEAAIRAMLYVAGADRTADERMFAVLRQIRAEHGYDIHLAEFKALVRDQFFMLLVDEDAAVVAIRDLAMHEPARIPEVITGLNQLAAATGTPSGEQAIRLARIDRLLAEAAAPLIPSPAKSSAGGLPSHKVGRSKPGARSEKRGDVPARGKSAGPVATTSSARIEE
ncbi:MAG: DUF3141 domain-containing protein, partial [Hyphomicrobiales bacterium]|nr:DUF3141 domain-containing protein [Hyphomicrobiales bacterium]